MNEKMKELGERRNRGVLKAAVLSFALVVLTLGGFVAACGGWR